MEEGLFEIKEAITTIHRNFFLLIRRHQCNKVQGRQPSLTSRAHENEYRVLSCVSHYRLEGWFVHCSHARTVVFLREAFKVDFDWHWTNRRLEIKQAKLVDAQPVCDVLCISQCRRKSNKPDLISGLLADISHARDNYFNYRTTILSKQMDLINYDESHLRYIAPMLPISADTVPFLRCSNQQVRLLEGQ